MLTSRSARPSTRLSLVAVALVAGLVGGGVAYGAGAAVDQQQPAISTFTPRHADQVTNIDVLRQQIRNY